MNNYQEFVNKFIKLKNPSKDTLITAKKLLDSTSHTYYNTDKTSVLTDEEWDKLLNHFSKFAKYKAGVKPKEGKRLVEVGHMFPDLVGTLDKTNFVYNKDNVENLEVDTLENWFKSKNIPDNRKIKVAVSDKEDGNSVSITYEGSTNKHKLSLTRGKDGQGADLSSLFRNRKLDLVKTGYKGTIGVKYEAMINDENFKLLSEEIGKPFANARSMVAGILGSNDGAKYSDKITLVPIRIQYGNDHITRDNRRITREEEIELVNKSKCGIDLNFKFVEGTVKEVLKGIKKIYDEYNNGFRQTLDHAIDGLVIEILDEDLRQKLGRSDDRNNYDVALKFPYMVKPSKVKDIKFYYGKTGRITPVVVFDTVIFNGAKCNHVSIANYKRFRELNLHKGDSIFVEYRNDVLSYITKDPTSKPTGERIKFISKCPKCDSKLKVNDTKTFVFCDNIYCEGLVKGKIENWFTKLNIKGIKLSTIDKLVNADLVDTIPDLYKLKKEDILKIEGFKDKSAENIIKTINSKKEIYDWELLGSLGFKDVGRTTAKLVLKEMSLNELLECDDPHDLIRALVSIQGIQTITASNILNGITTNIDIIERLLKILKIKSLKDEISSNATTEPQSLVFTGFRDADMQNKLESKGHSVKSSVSGNTDMLVIKDLSKGGSKLAKAKTLGISVYTLDEFKAKILPTL